MPRFRLVPTKRFEDDFRELPKRIQGQVLKALEKNPDRPAPRPEVTGVEAGRWRYRWATTGFGTILRDRPLCFTSLRHRKEVYRR